MRLCRICCPIQANCDGKSAVIPTSSKKPTGMQCEGYNGLTLREQGAPEEIGK